MILAINVLKQIICIWLFYVLHGILIVGLVKVEVRTTVQQKQTQNIFESAKIQTGLWTGTISERIYIRNNVIQKERSNKWLPYSTAKKLTNTVSVTRGLCTIFGENHVWWQFVLIIQSLLSIVVFVYVLLRVGGKIKWLLEKLTTSLPASVKCCKNKTLNSIVMSLLFLVLGLTLCIPLRNLYLAHLANQEDKIIAEISHQLTANNANVYLSVTVDWMLVYYFSFLNIGFLLSFSYCSATIIDVIREELKQQFTDKKDEIMTVGLPPCKYFNV